MGRRVSTCSWTTLSVCWLSCAGLRVQGHMQSEALRLQWPATRDADRERCGRRHLLAFEEGDQGAQDGQHARVARLPAQARQLGRMVLFLVELPVVSVSLVW